MVWPITGWPIIGAK